MSAKTSVHRWPSAIAIAFLLLAVLEMPGAYYMLLRFVLCSVLVWQTVQLRFSGLELAWLTGLAALLYNPFFPVYLYNKAIWTLINFLTIGLIVMAQIAMESKRPVDKSDE